MAKLGELRIPHMGSVENARIVAWHVEEGAGFVEGQLLYEAETDKTLTEVTADVDGVLARRLANEGDELKVGDLVGWWAPAGSDAGAIAAALAVKHPKTTDGPESADWVMTTDFLITLRKNYGTIELLAVAIKSDNEITKKRSLELLAIERAYWVARGVNWLLITPALYDERVGLNLRMQMPWTLGERASAQDRLKALEIVRRFPGRSLTFILHRLEATLGNMDLAQRAFWQAVYSGEIPMSLRRGWRPHQPVVLLPQGDFNAQNPIASRSSAWI